MSAQQEVPGCSGLLKYTLRMHGASQKQVDKNQLAFCYVSKQVALYDTISIHALPFSSRDINAMLSWLQMVP